MVSLQSVQNRFEIDCHVIAGGSGVVRGVISEADQTLPPSYTFTNPRRIFRANPASVVRTGMVIRTPAGAVFIVGKNGYSEVEDQLLWNSFRLFEATGQYTWKRRTKTVDPITRLETDGLPIDLGMIWMAVEPLDREVFDRKLHLNLEQSRFITGEAILADDILNSQIVVRCDFELGLRIGVMN
jgi:protein gp37